MRLMIQKQSIRYGSVLSAPIGALILWAKMKGISDLALIGIGLLAFVWIFAVVGDTLESRLNLKKKDQRSFGAL